MKKTRQHWFINKQNCLNSYYKVRKVFSSFTTVNKHHMYQKRKTLAKRTTLVAPLCFCFILSELQLALFASTKQYKLWHYLISLKWTQPLAPVEPWTRTYINIPTHSASASPSQKSCGHYSVTTVTFTFGSSWQVPSQQTDHRKDTQLGYTWVFEKCERKSVLVIVQRWRQWGILVERELGRWVTVITKVCANCNRLVVFDIPLMLLYVHTDHKDC